MLNQVVYLYEESHEDLKVLDYLRSNLIDAFLSPQSFNEIPVFISVRVTFKFIQLSEKGSGITDESDCCTVG